MRAMVIERFGGPEVFQVRELPDPAVRPGTVLVRQAATSVNPAEYKMRRAGPAIAPELPAVLGCDISGTVEAVGDGVTGLAPGDAVYGCGAGVRGMAGAYAELVLTDPALLARRPRTLDARTAAALPLVAITAYEGLVDRARVEPGETVLVFGATGGVGHVALQIARARGARVVATVGSSEKAAIARELGADAVVDRRGTTVADMVAAHTDGRGFDVVFDSVGGDNLPLAFAAARPQGRVVSIVTQQSYDLVPMHAKGLSLHVIFMLLPMLTGVGRERHGQILRAVAALVDEGSLRPLVDPQRFTLEQVGAAQAALEAGRVVGKLVVDIAA